MTGAPVAAIVVPAFNAQATLRRTLDSIATAIEFHRAFVDDRFEIVVVDDCSADETPVIARQWAAARRDTDVVRLDRNCGASRARNEGAARATAPLLFFLDADDDFLPPHLYCCIETMKGLPEAGYARPSLKFDVAIHDTWKAMLRQVLPSNACVRKVCHDFVGGFLDHDHLRTHHGEDVIYARMISRYYAGVLIDLATVHYRSYPGNAFDRQLPRLRLPVGEGADTRNAAERALEPEVTALVNARFAELDAAARATGATVSGAPRLWTDSHPPVWHARDIAQWLEIRLKTLENRPDSAD